MQLFRDPFDKLQHLLHCGVWVDRLVKGPRVDRGFLELSDVLIVNELTSFVPPIGHVELRLVGWFAAHLQLALETFRNDTQTAKWVSLYSVILCSSSHHQS